MTIDGVRFWGAPWYSDLWSAQRTRARSRPRTIGVIDFRRTVHDGGGEWTLSRHIDQHTASDRSAARAGGPGGRGDYPLAADQSGLCTHEFEGDSLNPYVYNDREDLVRAVGAKLWISGHVPRVLSSTRWGATRVIGNPAGYPDKRPHLAALPAGQGDRGLAMAERMQPEQTRIVDIVVARPAFTAKRDGLGPPLSAAKPVL